VKTIYKPTGDVSLNEGKLKAFRPRTETRKEFSFLSLSFIILNKVLATAIKQKKKTFILGKKGRQIVTGGRRHTVT
jgi:hypothetical protein